MNILMNIDHGTIPAATYKIITDLSINDQELGLFGSLVFVGNLIGALASLTLINLLNSWTFQNLDTVLLSYHMHKQSFLSK